MLRKAIHLLSAYNLAVAWDPYQSGLFNGGLQLLGSSVIRITLGAGTARLKIVWYCIASPIKGPPFDIGTFLFVYGSVWVAQIYKTGPPTRDE